MGATGISTPSVQSAGRGYVRLEQSGAVAHLVLDRPPLNVLHLDMLSELLSTLEQFSNERSSRVLVLHGAGKGFCAGVDVADHTADRVERMLELFHAVIRAVMAMECPTIAAVHGPALGGGCELMLACDIVLAREDAKIGQPEIRLGAFPPVAAALLPRLVGRQHAMDLILTGRVLEAARATEIGLVTEVLATAAFGEEVQAYASRLAGLSGPVLTLAKRAVRIGTEAPPEEAIARAERIYLSDLMPLHDAREGVSAFMEKRDPVWKEG